MECRYVAWFLRIIWPELPGRLLLLEGFLNDCNHRVLAGSATGSAFCQILYLLKSAAPALKYGVTDFLFGNTSADADLGGPHQGI